MRRAALGLFLVSALVLAAGIRSFASAEASLPSLLTRYEVSWGKGAPELLEILRTDARIEHRLHAGRTIEVWERDERGEITHLKVFPQAQRVVRYTAGDLRTLQVEPNWEELGSLIGAAERNRLKAHGSARVAGERAVRLVGALRGAPATLLWLEHVGVPTRLTSGHGARAHTLKLLSLERCPAAACSFVDTTEYREIDFADLGDSEHDPFVKKFLAATGAGHSH